MRALYSFGQIFFVRLLSLLRSSSLYIHAYEGTSKKKKKNKLNVVECPYHQVEFLGQLSVFPVGAEHCPEDFFSAQNVG